MTFTIFNKGCSFSSWFHKEHSKILTHLVKRVSHVQSWILMSNNYSTSVPFAGKWSQVTTTLTYGFHRLARQAEQLTESSDCRGRARKGEAQLDEACSSMTTGNTSVIHSQLPLSPERSSNFRELTTKPPHSCQIGLEAACLSATSDPWSAADAIGHSLGLVLPYSWLVGPLIEPTTGTVLT